MTPNELPLTLHETLADLRCGRLSAVELMSATYDALERLNPALNALVSVIPHDQALARAREADERRARGDDHALLGVPIACKDGEAVEGLPTTFGFVPWASNVARRDSLVVARQRAAGAIPIGKTNMPEFGLGSHTFNELFGATRNPYDTSRTPGGSSGGAASALAAGLLQVADGSDMGGSLRNPASFCNVVGFRPSIGRVPSVDGMGWLGRIATAGPMARTVADAARLFAVLAGPNPLDPLSRTSVFDPEMSLDSNLGSDQKPLRIALSENLNLPVEPEVRAVVRGSEAVFRTLGCEVTDAAPDLSGAMDVFQVQRAAGLAALGRALDSQVPSWRSHAKATMQWNVDKGLALSADELLRSEARRSALFRRFVRFFEQADYLVLPSAQVPPFSIDTEYPTEVAGEKMETYIDWMAVCCVISITGAPAISVPAGFSSSRLPIGLQIVGRPGDDLGVLKVAHSFEQATLFGGRRPDLSVWS